VAPALLVLTRRIQREKLKDGLRAWLDKRAEKMEMERRREESRMAVSVRGLVRKYTAVRKAVLEDEGRQREVASTSRWGRRVSESEKVRHHGPTRAAVFGMRRFWEGVARAGDMAVS